MESKQRCRNIDCFAKGEYPPEEIDGLLDNLELSANELTKIYSFLVIGYPSIFNAPTMKARFRAEIERRNKQEEQVKVPSKGKEKEEMVDVSSVATTIVQGTIISLFLRFSWGQGTVLPTPHRPD